MSYYQRRLDYIMPRVILGILAALTLGGLLLADEYQCDSPDYSGCLALNNNTGIVIKFRHGDIVSTEREWIVAGEEGWVLLPGLARVLDVLPGTV